jgi:hypothetical protein
MKNAEHVPWPLVIGNGFILVSGRLPGINIISASSKVGNFPS